MPASVLYSNGLCVENHLEKIEPDIFGKISQFLGIIFTRGLLRKDEQIRNDPNLLEYE